MKIITVTEPRFYTHWTTTLALRDIASTIGAEFEEYWIPPCYGVPFTLDEVKQEDDEVIAVIHAAHLKIAKIKVSDLRSKWPKAKIVTLGSDTIPYTVGEGHHESLLTDKINGFEFVSPLDADLHLDSMWSCVQYLRGKGVKADHWLWSVCNESWRLADYMLSMFKHVGKTFDAICFGNVNIQNDNYRRRMWQHLSNRGLRIYFGGSLPFTTLEESELKKIYLHYISSCVTIGTTSPSWTSARTMKGWRDSLGIVLGAPLVYDQHEEIEAVYPDIVPLYDYNNFDSLADLIFEFRDNRNKADDLCDKQRSWLKNWTIEKQFMRKFAEYGII